MAGAKFEYDENGSTFFYFLLSFEALVVIPCTYYFLSSKRVTRSPIEKERTCHCDNCSIKNSRLRAKEPWRKAKQRFIKFLLLISWILLILTFYKVTTLQQDVVSFDPFAILQIESDASMTEIKRAYRKLSLQYHPDKSSGDEKRFMMIAKAYSALTQDEARKNWELFGNPDGPGATSFGIALPAWIVDQENSLFVLGVYALLFMIALPIAVGLWWYRSMNLYTEAVLYATVKLYYRYICTTPHMLFKRVIMIIAASLEFEHSHNKEIEERPSDNIEIPNLIRVIGTVGEKNRERPLCFGYSIKARTLIYAHLSRLKLGNTLEEDKLVIIRKCPVLIQEFVSCTAQCTMVALAGKLSRMPSLDTMENAMKLSPCIVQAMWNHQNSLLQLPHLTEDMLKHFTTRKRNIRSIWHLASMHDDDRRAMLRCLTDDQYEDVMNVIANLPVITLNVKSEVLDDEDSCTLTAGAIVTVTVTLIRKNMSTLFKAKEIKSDNLYAEKEEKSSVANGIESIKKPVWQKQKKKKSSGKPKAPRNAARNRKGANGVLPNGVTNTEKAKDSEGESDSDDDSEKKKEEDAECAEENDAAKDAEEDEAEWDKFQTKKKDKTQLETNKAKLSHTVHCPFFPDNKQECWWLYIADKRRHALITNPFLVTTLVDNEDIELKFSAPSKPGLYSYAVIVRSDSYLDFDVIKVLQLDIKEAKVVDFTKVQWDVSEEEEEKDEDSAVEDSELSSGDGSDDD